MNKEQFRDQIRTLKQTHFENRDHHYFFLSKRMTEKVLEFEAFQHAQKIGIFASKKESYEIHTDDLINYALSHQKELYLPRCIPENRDLEFLKISDLENDTQKAHFSIREPKKDLSVPDQEKLLQELDLLFVPGMAFYDKNGKRLGFGSGYYDKFLATMRKLNSRAPVIGLGFDFQVFSQEIPYREYDSHVDYIITPKRIIQI